MAQGQVLNRDPGTYTYDEVGRVAAGTDAAGLTLEFAYDDLNHVIRVSYPDGTSKDLTYSSCCPHLITSTTDRAGRTTQFTYNTLQKLTGVTYPDGATVNFGYDADMNRTGVTDPNGKTTTFAYDSLDRLIRQTDPTGSVTMLHLAIFDSGSLGLIETPLCDRSVS